MQTAALTEHMKNYLATWKDKNKKTKTKTRCGLQQVAGEQGLPLLQPQKLPVPFP